MTNLEFEVLTGQIHALSMGLTAVMGALSGPQCRTAVITLQASLDVEQEDRGSTERAKICRELVEAYLDLLKARSARP